MKSNCVSALVINYILGTTAPVGWIACGIENKSIKTVWSRLKGIADARLIM